MEISNAHQYQAMGGSSSSSNILPLEEVLVGCSKTSSQQHQEMRKVMKPHPEQSLKCPRCDSTNTKFCYYNNYSLSQPRYYCKGCRRYWTKGGSLRNVPIGGGCRKNKKSSSSSSSSSSSTSSKRPQDSNSNPHLSSFMAPSHLANYDPSHDHLTLAFADLHKQPLANGFFVGNPSSGSSSGFLDILRNGFVNNVANNQSTDWNSLYGIGCNGDGVQEVEDVVMPFINVGFDGATTYTTTTTTTSAHDNMAAAMDSGRDYWNGVAPPPSSSWHGLINNSLM